MNLKTIIPVPLFIVLLVILAILDVEAAFEFPILLFILNTVFISLVGIIVAYLAARSYLQTGLRNLFLLGCGALVFGATSFAAGAIIGTSGGLNSTLTLHNTGALFGSICHLAATGSGLGGIAPGRMPGSRKAKIVLAYLGVLLFTLWLTIASQQGLTPPFFIPGEGPTLLRQVVVVSAAALYAISAFLVMRLYLSSKSEFLHWYAVGLALIAVGLATLMWVHVVGSPISWAGRAAQYLGGLYFLQAVSTALRHNGAVLLERAITNFFREAETNYRILVEMATDAIIAFDRQGRILLWNSAAGRVFGYSQPEVIGSFLTDLIVPEQRARQWQQELESFTGSGESQLMGRVAERELKRKDNSLFPAELSISARKSAEDWVGIGIIRDITERRRAEAARQESEQRYRLLFEQMLSGFALHEIICDTTGQPVDYRFLEVNPAFEKLTGLCAAELIGKTAREVLPGLETHWIERYGRVALTGEPTQFENYAGPLDRYFEVVAFCPCPGQFATVFADVTERKQAEEQLKVSLREKEMLLREVQHRVKNNLQAILNLLYLQAEYIQDSQVQQIFQDTQARIKSIALVHEKLFQTKDLAQLNFAEYLASLTKHLIYSYGIAPERITVSINAEVTSLDLDTAVPLGIIINELVSNSLKYAFPEGRQGEIRIEVKANGAQLHLTVTDNGIGFPDDVDLTNPDTLGLQLVSMLTTHLKGQLEVSRSGGTTFKIWFTPIWTEPEPLL